MTYEYELEHVLWLVSNVGGLAICCYAYYRQRLPGWLVLVFWSFCQVLAAIDGCLLTWESKLIRQDILLGFMRCDSLVCDLLLVVALGLLAKRHLPRLSTAPA